MAELRFIDGDTKRDIAANEVNAAYAESTEALLVECERMSGFLIVVFDDHGNPYSQLYLGENFPMPSPMLPEIVKQCTIAHVYEA